MSSVPGTPPAVAAGGLSSVAAGGVHEEVVLLAVRRLGQHGGSQLSP